MTNQLLIQVILQILTLGLFSLIYFMIRRNVEYLITSFLLGLTTFFLILILSHNEFGIATGLGLFAIFGIIRYRTEVLPIVEMTYIFICITISVINAIVDNIILSTSTAIIFNSIQIAFAAILIYWNKLTELASMIVVVDSVEWLSGSDDEKVKYLSGKTFHTINRYHIELIDWLTETCKVRVFYKQQKSK